MTWNTCIEPHAMSSLRNTWVTAAGSHLGLYLQEYMTGPSFRAGHLTRRFVSVLAET